MSPGTQDPTLNPSYMAGYRMAEAELADESQEVREAVARAWGRQKEDAPMQSRERMALMGGLAYLAERHENNQR